MHIVEGVVKAKVTVGQLGIVESITYHGSERFGIGWCRVLDTVRKNGKMLIHVTKPRNQASQITKGTCIGTFSPEVEDSAVIGQLSTSMDQQSGAHQSQEGKAAQINKIASELSNTVDITDGPKHRLYKLIKTNADVFSVDGEFGV